MSLHTPLRRWLPPALHGAIGRASGRSQSFTGRPRDWAQALAQSRGYADRAILERVVQATREVVAGRAAFERDSVLFDRWEPPFQLLAPLLRHALRHGGRLDVVDFGGSLGSTYRLCRRFLPEEVTLRWHVVEQADFVAAGRAEFSTDELGFHGSLAELPTCVAPRLLLVSSVLQYLEDPTARIAEWNVGDADALVIDRTPIGVGPAHRLCIQQVPRHIYRASYPCWILSRERLLEQLASHWQWVCEFDSPEGRHSVAGGPSFDFKGFVLERSKA